MDRGGRTEWLSWIERGDELVGLAAVEAVPAVEAPGERPASRATRPCRVSFSGREVPLADGVGGVARWRRISER